MAAAPEILFVPRALTRETLALGVRALARQDPDFAALYRRNGLPPMWARRPGFATLVHIVLEQQVSIDAEQFLLRFLGISNETAIESVAASFDIGQQCCEHSARAALGRRHLELLVADLAHQPLGLLVQMIGKGRLERLAQPRSPLVGAAASRSGALLSRVARNSLSVDQLGHSREFASRSPTRCSRLAS